MDVPGTIRKGCGFAAGCLTLQFPHVIKEFPEIRECHMGTINVVLDISLIVVAPDYRTQRIAWDPSRPEIIEDFGFLRIQFEHPSSGQSAPAWIYISSGSPYPALPAHARGHREEIGELGAGYAMPDKTDETCCSRYIRIAHGYVC